VVVRGRAEVTVANDVFVLEKNQSTYIPPGTVHRLANVHDEPLEIIEVQTGDYLGEDDIERLEDDYHRQSGD
jgi:mannose-1-phosphate guanylyltransferase/mannose-6-phosphate isomerase